MVVEVALLGVLVVGAGLDLLLGEHAAEQVLRIRALVIYLLFVNDGVALDVGGRTDDFFGALSQLVGEVLGGRHVPLLELVLLHAVTD